MRGRDISVVNEAEQVVRNYIGQGEGITIPTWLFAGGIGLIVGIMTGPALMATTEEGSRRLAELARQRVAK